MPIPDPGSREAVFDGRPQPFRDRPGLRIVVQMSVIALDRAGIGKSCFGCG